MSIASFFRSALQRPAVHLLLLFVVASVPYAPVSAAPANSEIARIMKERSVIEENLRGLKLQLKEYQSKLNSTKKAESKSLKALENIRQQILVLEKMIGENQRYLEKLNRDIDRLQHELQGNRQTYGRVSDAFSRTAVSVYKYGGNRDVEHLFASGSVNDAIVRAQYMGFFSRAVRRNVDELQDAAVKLEHSKQALEQSYRQKAAAVREQESQLKNWSQTKKEKEVVLDRLKKNKQEYAIQLETARRKRAQLQSRIEGLILAEQRAIEAENERHRKALEAKRLEARRVDARKTEAQRAQARRQEAQRLEAERAARKEKRGVPSPPPSIAREETPKPESPAPRPSEKGGTPVPESISPELDRVSVDFDNALGSLPWPVRNGVVSRRFGSVEDKDLRIVTTNNGIDLSVPANTPVRAVSGGKVAQIAFLPTFGNIVIIRHPKSYLTVYANLGQLNVVKDELIKSQQLLGLSSRAPEGGSVVHFEIWKGRVKQNPEKWLKR